MGKTWKQKIVNKRSRENTNKISLEDFFAESHPGSSGPVNGGGHLYLKLKRSDLELVKHTDELGVERREIRARRCRKGSSIDFNVFEFGVLTEELLGEVKITLRENNESKITWASGAKNRWEFEIDLTEENFFYVMRQVTGLDPFSGDIFDVDAKDGQIEIHGDRFALTTDGKRIYAARLLTVIVNGQAESNEFAIRKRGDFLTPPAELQRKSDHRSALRLPV